MALSYKPGSPTHLPSFLLSNKFRKWTLLNTNGTLARFFWLNRMRQNVKSSEAFQIQITESNNIPQALLQWISGEELLEACSTAIMVEKNAMLKPTSYETKYFVFLKRVPSKNNSVMKPSALHITALVREIEKKEGAASNWASLALIKPFFIHLFFHPPNFLVLPSFSSLQLFHPPNLRTLHITASKGSQGAS